MTEYKRLTDEDWLTTISVNDTNDPKLIEYAFRLWQLENQIKYGVLVELPCKVGDTVYTVEYSPNRGEWFVKEYRVYGYSINDSKVVLYVDFDICVQSCEVYYTEAEAEAELEKIRSSND